VDAASPDGDALGDDDGAGDGRPVVGGSVAATAGALGLAAGAARSTTADRPISTISVATTTTAPSATWRSNSSPFAGAGGGVGERVGGRIGGGASVMRAPA
jgi:hypothetical protein